jgi:hypothetical protein
MCNKSIICGVLFASGAITFYEGNNTKGVLCYALHTQIFDPSFVHWRFKNISVTTFVAEIGVPREIHRSVASY